MTLYKYGQRLTQENDLAFDGTHAPGTAAPPQESTAVLPAAMKSRTPVVILFSRKIIASTTLALALFNGNFWFTPCNSSSAG